MHMEWISQDAQNKRRKRPPDGDFAYTVAIAQLEQPQSQQVLDTAIWLSGNELKHRVIQFYSGSRTSKKRR